MPYVLAQTPLLQHSLLTLIVLLQLANVGLHIPGAGMIYLAQ